MSKHDFALSEFQDRQRRVRAEMERAGLDLLLVISPVNVNYLIGSRGKIWQFFRCLFFTLEDRPLTYLVKLAEVAEVEDLSLAGDVRGWGGREPEDPIDAFRAVMEEKGFLDRRIGLEAPAYHLGPKEYERIKAVLGGARVVDATHLVESLKLVKSPAELAYIRRAAGICDAGVDTFLRALAPGRTEFEVVAEVHRTMMALGSDAPASPMNFASGERTCYGHGLPSERRLEPGDLCHTEYGASYRRYHATIGRVFCLGTPTPRMREIYRVVRGACDACIAEIRAGVPALRPHQAAKWVIAEAGMDRYRLHTTGYGIGPGFPPLWGESAHMFGDSSHVLQAGMVVSIEPPVFIHQERLGARLIDNVLVTATGAEVLSRSSRDLIEV
ncbi:MAG: aminopeptidase P family protein [Proteobacteria bacterium]|nr:aminopeptidase P family protein [Pseudomonadota bacterium]